MRLNVFVEPQQGATYEQQLRMALTAEELGFDGFFRSDHFPRIGEGEPGPGPTDAFVTHAGAETVYLQVLDLDDLDHVRLLAEAVMPAVRDR